MVAIARQLEQEYPNTNSGNTASARPLFETLIGTARPMLYVLFGAVLTMLLIACVNLANLMLSRAAGRTQEMAVRRSLGAARWRIARQMLTESLLLAIFGGIAGVALAYAGFEALVALLPPNQPRIHVISIDLRVLSMAAAASIGTGILFGLMPAIQAATGKSMTLLRSSRVTGTANASAGTRRTLMLAEVALALVLVTGAGLMLRTMNNLAAIDTGFEHEQIVTAQFNLPLRYTTEKRLLFLDQSLERLRAIPGVTRAAFTYSIPVAGSNWNSIFIVEGQPVPERNQLPSSAWIPVERGVSRDDGDSSDQGPLVRQSRSAGCARSRGRQRDVRAAVFRHQRSNRRAREAGLAGRQDAVAADRRRGQRRSHEQPAGRSDTAGVPARYARPGSDPAPLWCGRTAIRPTLGRSIEAAIHEIDPNLPLFNIQTMNEIIDASIGNERLTMVLLIGFAALALLMAAIGVFGVTAYSVSQRTHELGIRMALGANRGSVLALVLRQEMGACLIGIAVGVVGALFLGIAARITAVRRDAAGHGDAVDRGGRAAGGDRDRVRDPRAARHPRRSGDGTATRVDLQVRLKPDTTGSSDSGLPLISCGVALGGPAAIDAATRRRSSQYLRCFPARSFESRGNRRITVRRPACIGCRMPNPLRDRRAPRSARRDVGC